MTYTHEQYVEKANKKHKNFYKYPYKYQGNDKLLKIECPKHGIFEQQAKSHLTGRGCSDCGNDRRKEKMSKSHDDFMEELEEKRGTKEYDYSLVEYKGANIKIKIICLGCDKVFEQLPSDHKNGKGCPNCGQKRANKKNTKTQEKFIEEGKETHGDLYDYSLVEYKKSRIPVKIICKRCGEIFEQNPIDHTSGYGCKSCSFKELSVRFTKSKEQFVKDANKKFPPGMYDYTDTVYINDASKLDILCNSCGEIFSQVANGHLNGNNGCKNCQIKSRGEKKLKELLKSLGIKYIPQGTVTVIPNRRYDFYFKVNGRNYILEYDGIQHFKYVKFFKLSLEENHTIDIIKTYIAIRAGYTVLRISYKHLKNLETKLKEALNIPEDKDLY